MHSSKTECKSHQMFTWYMLCESVSGDPSHSSMWKKLRLRKWGRGVKAAYSPFLFESRNAHFYARTLSCRRSSWWLVSTRAIFASLYGPGSDYLMVKSQAELNPTDTSRGEKTSKELLKENRIFWASETRGGRTPRCSVPPARVIFKHFSLSKGSKIRQNESSMSWTRIFWHETPSQISHSTKRLFKPTLSLRPFF